MNQENTNTKKFCPNCGKEITKFLYPKRQERKWVWDSFECFKQKPRKILELEEDFGKPITEILIETAQKFGTLKAQSIALGMSVPSLYRSINKYFNMSMQDFMLKYSVGRRRGRHKKRELTKTLKLLKYAEETIPNKSDIVDPSTQ